MFGTLQRYARLHGIAATILLIPFKLHLISLAQLGRVAGWLRLSAHVDATSITLTSPLITPTIKAGLLLGGYEKQERAMLEHFLPPDLPVIELGASIGVISCIANRKLHHPEQHVVVEANPDLLPLLEQNRVRNQAAFMTVFAALAYGSEQVTFFTNQDNVAGGMYEQHGQKRTVATTSLAALVHRAGFERFTLICDIEGSEADLIEHELPMLAKAVAVLIIELHPRILGDERCKELLHQLEAVGFERVAMIDTTYCFQRGC
jgi:FkbM family methyltransferase